VSAKAQKKKKLGRGGKRKREKKEGSLRFLLEKGAIPTIADRTKGKVVCVWKGMGESYLASKVKLSKGKKEGKRKRGSMARREEKKKNAVRTDSPIKEKGKSTKDKKGKKASLKTKRVAMKKRKENWAMLRKKKGGKQ